MQSTLHHLRATALPNTCFTDGSVLNNSCTLSVVVLEQCITLQCRLFHIVLTVISELAALRESVRYILSKLPREGKLFTDSQSALQVLIKVMIPTRQLQQALEIPALFPGHLNVVVG